MLTGRKLLLADDSVAIQKVIDLTFTDEGMKVTTVGDGDRALIELEGIAPDIVLADVMMPGVDGYELCRLIKQSERLNAIPVILLVGSFEPFNEARARRVGANDVVTKPFQSIRDLVSRVGSLLGKEAATDPHEYSTLGLGQTIDAPSHTSAADSTTDPDLKVMVEASSPDVDSMQDEEVTVLVEAASIIDPEPTDVAGASCATDVEMQTADTRQLERIDDEEFGSTFTPALYAQDDTIEIEPVRKVEKVVEKGPSMMKASAETRSIDTEETKTTQPLRPPAAPDMFSDTLLDLDYFSSAAQPASGEGVVLDLDFEESTVASPPSPMVEASVRLDAALVDAPPTEVVGAESLVETAAAAAQAHDWSPDWSMVPAAPAEQAAPVAEPEEAQAGHAGQAAHSDQTPDQAAALEGVSPELIDAIARRVVEQMSEKVVREIAWEVVPDLAELLIKKKLEEEK